MYTRMAASINTHFFLMITLPAILIVLVFSGSATAQLSANFYATSCRTLPTIVLNGMRQAVNGDRRMGASILRLFFHDCFVNVYKYIYMLLLFWKFGLMLLFFVFNLMYV